MNHPPPLTVLDRLIWLGFMVLAGVWAACALAGCKTPAKPTQTALQAPLSPWGPSGPPLSALSRASLVVPPPPSTLTVAWDGSPGAGSYIVQGSSNLVTWQTLYSTPADRTNYQATVPGWPLMWFRAGVTVP